jgi:hypothetical protein
MDRANTEKVLNAQTLGRCLDRLSSGMVVSCGTLLLLVTLTLQVTGVCLGLPGSLIGCILVALGSLLAHLTIAACAVLVWTLCIYSQKALTVLHALPAVSLLAALASIALLPLHQHYLFLQVSKASISDELKLKPPGRVCPSVHRSNLL